MIGPRPSFLAALLLLLGVVPAAATATLTCEAEDRNLAFNLMGSVGQSTAAVVQMNAGSIKLKAVPGRYDAIEFEVGPSGLIQQWLFQRELRIGIQSAEKNDISIYLAIVARQIKSGDSGDRYQGRYLLKVMGPKGTLERNGRINGCEAG